MIFDGKCPECSNDDLDVLECEWHEDFVAVRLECPVCGKETYVEYNPGIVVEG